MKKLAISICLILVLLFSGCSENISIEKNEFPLKANEVSAILSENNTNWYIEKTEVLSDKLTAMIVYSDNENEFRNNSENPTQAEKAVGAVAFYNSDDGQRIAFQYLTFRPNMDTFQTILPKSIDICCDMYSVNAADNILKDISNINLNIDIDYSYWYKEYGSVYAWLQYKVERGKMIPIAFSINDEGAHNIMLQQYRL